MYRQAPVKDFKKCWQIVGERLKNNNFLEKGPHIQLSNSQDSIGT